MDAVNLNWKKIFMLVSLLLFTFVPMAQSQEMEDDGYRREYYAEGQLLSETDCLEEDDTAYYREFFQNGNLRMEVSYPTGYLYGIYADYCETGSPQVKLDYKNFKRDGVYSSYYENGKLQTKGEYVDGKATGLHQVYYPSGQLATENQYTEGAKNGTGKTYYPNGSVWEEFLYQNGLPEGKYLEYNPQGIVIKEIDYERGEVVRAKNYDAERQMILEVLQEKFDGSGAASSRIQEEGLHKCVSNETGIAFACDPDWKLKRRGRTLTITISEVPRVEMVVEESDQQLRFPHEISREALVGMGRYADDFQIERFRHCDRETVKVNGRLKGEPGSRVSDFYMIDHYVLHSVRFTVAPDTAWEDYKWLIKDIIDSLQFIKQTDVIKFATEETNETCEELVK